MWAEAKKLDGPERRAELGPLEGLRDLTDQEYDACLLCVHEHYRKHRGQVQRQKQVLVAKDAGPRSAAERGQACEAYNGAEGGCKFTYYSYLLFVKELAKRGATVSRCSEAVCMEALQATHVFLQNHPLARGDAMREHAGPQCFPQLQEEARLRANRPLVEGDAAAEEGDARAGVEQLRDGWLCCARCGKWRLVELASLPALREEEYAEPLPGETFDWGAWLDQAGARWAAFEARQPQDGAARTEVEDEESEDSGGEGQAGRDAESEVSRASTFGSESEGDCPRREFEKALGKLGSKSGWLEDWKRQELERLEAQERGAEVCGQARFKPLFVCPMLMRHAPEGVAAGGLAWQTMSCADPDDFQALKSTRWPVEDFDDRDVVCVWDPDAESPPVNGEAFVRFGRMLHAAEAAGAAAAGEDAGAPDLGGPKRHRRQRNQFAQA